MFSISSPTEPTAPNPLNRGMSPAAGEASCTNNKALETCQIRAQSRWIQAQVTRTSHLLQQPGCFSPCVVLRPEQTSYLRELQRQTGLASASPHRALRRLTLAGLVLEQPQGNLKLFRAN